MKSNHGIALIASLLVMAVIMTIGIGSLSLAMMNSRIAENARASSLAEANAETATNAALTMLKQSYETNGKKFPASVNNKFPNTVTIPRINNVAAFAAADYTYVSTDQKEYRLTVKGRTASGGLYLSEVLVTSTGITPEVRGLVSEGRVSATGGNSIYTDADIHGNAGYDIKDVAFYECEKRAADGTCPDADKTRLSGSDIPVTTSDGGNCTGNISTCRGGVPEKTISRQTVTPNYLGLRDTAITASDVSKMSPPRGGMTSTVNGIKCDYSSSGFSSLSDTEIANILNPISATHPVLCFDGGTVTLPSTLSNVTVISTGGVKFSGTPTINKSTVISRTGTVDFGKSAKISDSKIFSQGDIDLSGTQTVISGITTVATAGNMTIGGASKKYDTPGADGGIGIAFIAEGNIEANGASEWYAEVRAGGKFIKKGSIKDMYGSIAAKGDIEVSGNIVLDTGLPILNTDALVLTPVVLSRR